MAQSARREISLEHDSAAVKKRLRIALSPAIATALTPPALRHVANFILTSPQDGTRRPRFQQGHTQVQLTYPGARLQGVVPHHRRRLSATILMHESVGFKTAQALLGNSGARLTIGLYPKAIGAAN